MTAGLSAENFEFKGTQLYKDFLQERDEILKNKWFMSEREGRDVGFERALLDWVCNHREGWRKHK